MILLDKFLNKFRSEGKKVLIFSQLTMMFLILEDYLKFKQVKYEKIDGQIKARERSNTIDKFNDPSKKREVFLLSTKAGGQGINLTAAERLQFIDQLQKIHMRLRFMKEQQKIRFRLSNLYEWIIQIM